MKVNSSLTNGGYYMGVSDYYGNRVFWEVVEDHFDNEPNDNTEIVIQGFDFNIFMNVRGVID